MKDKIELESESLEAQAQEKLPQETILVLKKIVYYTAKIGLSLQEACVLSNIDYERFMQESKVEPLIGKIIKMKELEFKKDMIGILTKKAREGDDKLAQWLLEKKFPDEYSDKKKSGNNDDVLFEALRFIRVKGDNNPLISESTATNIVIEKKETIMEKIDKILK